MKETTVGEKIEEWSTNIYNSFVLEPYKSVMEPIWDFNMKMIKGDALSAMKPYWDLSMNMLTGVTAQTEIIEKKVDKGIINFYSDLFKLFQEQYPELSLDEKGIIFLGNPDNLSIFCFVKKTEKIPPDQIICVVYKTKDKTFIEFSLQPNKTSDSTSSSKSAKSAKSSYCPPPADAREKTIFRDTIAYLDKNDVPHLCPYVE